MASNFKKWPTQIVFSEFEKLPETRKIYKKGNEWDQFIFDNVDSYEFIWKETDKQKHCITYKININRVNTTYAAYTACILANSLYNNQRKVKISLEKLRANTPQHNRVSIRTISTHLNLVYANSYIKTVQEIYCNDHYGPNTYTFYEFNDYIEMYPEIYNHKELNAADIIYYARMKKIAKWKDKSFVIYKKHDELLKLLKISESHFRAIKKKFAKLKLITYKRQDGRGYLEITMTFEQSMKKK